MKMESIILITMWSGILTFSIFVIIRTLKNIVDAIGAIFGGRSKSKYPSPSSNMENFQIRTHREKATKSTPFEVIRIEGRGLIPTNHSRSIKFVTSVLDVTDSDNKPVISIVEDFQESGSTVFQNSINGGAVGENQGFSDWVEVGAVIPEVLVPAKGGSRNLKIVLRIVDANMSPSISFGLGETHDPAVLGVYAKTIMVTLNVKGYEEEADARDQSSPITVRLAMAVAMADGHLDKREGKLISAWIENTIATLPRDRRGKVKSACNNSLKESYADARSNKLSLSEVTRKLNVLADDSLKYQAIELCLDVMAADGLADASELEMIRNVAEALNLDYDELQKLKDQRMIGIEIPAPAEGQSNIEALLGIRTGWSRERIRLHISAEFKKWNGRISNLTDPGERDNAQNMLEIIAEARKKYA